jgi:hypothetical protein
MKPILFFFCLTSLLSVAHAADAPARVAMSKQKSTFAAKEARNPFWPIGWVKPNPKNADGNQAPPLISPASFNLTSVTMGSGARFAILNGKIVGEGQQFGLQMGSQVYKVTVQTIRDGEVVLAYEGGEVVVPLHRH